MNGQGMVVGTSIFMGTGDDCRTRNESETHEMDANRSP